MKRFLTIFKTDITVQFRNQLYSIGIGIALLLGITFAWLGSPEQFPTIMPALLLIFIGGTTFFYAGSLIFAENEQGTLAANMVSPLRVSEYLWSKILTLTLLATFESVTTITLSWLILNFSEKINLPNIPVLLAGIIIIGVIYILMGIIIIVRYEKITEFLIPMALIISILQLPFLHFWGVIESPIFLILPTSAPTMIIQGSFMPLEPWKWVYALVYSAALLTGLILWTYRSFSRFISERVG